MEILLFFGAAIAIPDIKSCENATSEEKSPENNPKLPKNQSKNYQKK